MPAPKNPQAPDSMALRLAIVTLVRSGRMSETEFALAQSHIVNLKHARKCLERLGVQFEDAPD